MLQTMKIGTRLALAFAVLLLLLSALAAGGISGAKRLTERSAALYGDRTVPLGVLAEISHLTQRNRVLVMDMLMDPGTANQATHAALTANVERIRALWKTYTAQPLSAEEDALARAFAQANATYLDQGLIPAAAALVGGKYDDGSELYINQIRPHAAKVQDAVQRLVELQVRVAADEFGAARAMSETIHVWML
ncbi:MAG: methyl-accepting chemotaxis protein, partial [Acidovorax sp.]